VGNVPFECSQNEFGECFKEFKGFIKAEIIYKNGTTVSRGFGFVTFDSPEHAKLLIDKESITFKDRNLRFTEYMMDSESYKSLKTQSNKDQYIFNDGCIRNKNFLIVKNINNNMTRKELCDIFSKFSKVGRHFIVTDQDTGTSKSYAVVEILNDTIYDLLLEQKEIRYDSLTFQVSKWRFQKNQDHQKITKYDLYKAFTIGKKFDMMNSYRITRQNFTKNKYFT
jgi:RNA recognition motif-containing protein